MVDAGAVVVEILQSSDYGPANQTALETWVKAYDITVSSLIDASSVASNQTKSALGVQEQVWIVELSTMKIVNKFSGSTSGTGTPSAQAAAPIIIGLLGGG